MVSNGSGPRLFFALLLDEPPRAVLPLFGVVTVEVLHRAQVELPQCIDRLSLNVQTAIDVHLVFVHEGAVVAATFGHVPVHA